MNISELIELLEQFRGEYGDLPVHIDVDREVQLLNENLYVDLDGLRDEKNVGSGQLALIIG